jgi:hypothetical protein
LSEERKVLIMPALTLFSNLLKASASSASLPSWLMKISGIAADADTWSASGEIVSFTESVMRSPVDGPPDKEGLYRPASAQAAQLSTWGGS